MIRGILTVLFLLLFLILTIPLMLVEWILGKFNPQARDKSSLAIVNWGFRMVLFFSGTKITVSGLENIPRDTAVLFVGNHRSYFDIVVSSIYAVRPTGYVAKKEIEKVPLLRIWMRLIHCTFLDRKDLKAGVKTILANIELLKSGISVFVFPEGTRNRTSELLLPFHDGSLKMADKSGCPIVPVTMYNTNAIFEDHMPFIRRAHVYLEYGKPIYMKDLSREEKKNVSSDIRNILSETYTRQKENFLA